MPEKRKHRRATLFYYLKIYDLDTGRVIGHLADISLGGLKLVSESEIIPGNDFHLRICLPDDHFCRKSFSVKAKSCWSTIDINPDYYAAGFCFSALSLQTVRLIKSLIQQYELGNNTTSVVYQGV